MENNIKEQIAEAMWNLCKRKDPGKVTVKDIVNECNVSRQIFYYYYQNIYDVIAYILERDIERVAEESLKMGDAMDASKHFIGFVFSNTELIRKGLKSKLRPDIENILFQTFKKYIRNMMVNAWRDIAIKSTDMEFLVDFLSCGLLGKVIQNCLNDEINIDEFCKQLFELVHARVNQLA